MVIEGRCIKIGDEKWNKMRKCLLLLQEFFLDANPVLPHYKDNFECHFRGDFEFVGEIWKRSWEIMQLVVGALISKFGHSGRIYRGFSVKS